MTTKLKFTGVVNIKRTNAEGHLVQDITFNNLVVSVGLQWIVGRLNDPVPAVMNYIAVGTGTALPVSGDNHLETELFRKNVGIPGGAVSGSTIQYTVALNPGEATGALTEAGIFDNSAGGLMLARTTFPVINKDAGDTVAISWTIAAQAA